jgi:hypothetical protein
MTSLEGWSSTIELHPRTGKKPGRDRHHVAYRFPAPTRECRIDGAVAAFAAGWSAEQGEKPAGLALQRAGRVAGAGWAAGPQQDQPEQGSKAPEATHSGGFGAGQVEQGEEVLSVQARVGPC